jgi:hypothetical protein
VLVITASANLTLPILGIAGEGSRWVAPTRASTWTAPTRQSTWRVPPDNADSWTA